MLSLRWITRPPRIWAALYILVVPVAGTIYYFLPPGSFSDSNITREPGYKHDLAATARLVSCAIKYQEYNYTKEEGIGPMYPYPPTYTFQGATYTIEPDTISVPASDVSVDSTGDITLIIQGWVVSHPLKEGPSQCSNNLDGGSFTDTITFAGTPTMIGGSGNNVVEGYLVSFSPTASSLGQPPLNALFPYFNSALGGPTKLDPSSSIMWLSMTTSEAVQRLSTEGEGDPKNASGLLIRMWYFSTITITTLGFGDITPVTSPARTLVGLEAISGVVLIGLFLNALTRKSDEHSN